MKILRYDDFGELACAVGYKYDEVKEHDDLDSVAVIAKYEEAREIICELICLGYGIASIYDFSDSEWNSYDDEYMITLLENNIWCEPVLKDDGYICIEDNVVYLMNNCNSKIISHIDTHDVYEVAIADECDYECGSCACNKPSGNCVNVSEDENGNTHGFTASKSDGDSYVSYSYYTSDDLSQDDIQKMLKAFWF